MYFKSILFFIHLKGRVTYCNTSIFIPSIEENSLPLAAKHIRQADRTAGQCFFFFLGQTIGLQNRLFKLDLNT